ncbi:unnamed protein product [Nyctereutes procyonoides]|uniref:Keratin, type II cytoskeletal 8 n=1 Tax=Nyctereutes procyonoides TaxID=34880 RepID=A0A811YIN3_NYCPR|nr:unnamed protein product [Nyctereutes procyonoides]
MNGIGLSLLTSTPASTAASTTSIRVTQKSYKSCSYKSGPSSHISYSALSQVGSFQGGMSVVRGNHGSGAWGHYGCLSEPEPAESLKLELDPNIQAVRTQEKEQIRSLNSLPPSLTGQLDTLRQEKLKLEVELGNMQKLRENFKNKYEGEIKELADMENECVLIKKDVDEACMNKIELESLLEGLAEINFLRQLSGTRVVLSTDNSRSLDLNGTIAQVKAQYEDIAGSSANPTDRKLLEGEESRLESGMQNMSIHTKTTNGYSGGLPNPGLNYGQSSFQSIGPGGSFSCGSSSKAVVVKKIKTQMGSWC